MPPFAKKYNKENKRADRKKFCFRCRKPGHIISNCRSENNSQEPSCYVCGGLDHTSRSCKDKKDGKLVYKFAKCFVCNEMGHLASQCEKNDKGVYPKGGQCNACGSVRHLIKDCPTRIKESCDTGEEYLSDDQNEKQVVPKKKLPKIVVF